MFVSFCSKSRETSRQLVSSSGLYGSDISGSLAHMMQISWLRVGPDVLPEITRAIKEHANRILFRESNFGEMTLTFAAPTAEKTDVNN